MEPANSYEVSYVISIKRSHVELEIDKKKLISILGFQRTKELREWADKNFNSHWFKWHI